MSRPVSIQNDRLLEVARRVFLEHGFKATTARVAREAGVSEGSLFKRFKSKTDLFLAAMRSESVVMPWHDRLLRSAGTGDVTVLLEGAGLELLQRLMDLMPRLMAVRSSGLLAREHLERHGERPPPVYHVHVLARYFRAEVRAGRLAMQAPEAQAHAFIGALSHYVFCDTLFGYRPARPQEYVRSVVSALVRAATPARAERGPGRVRRPAAKTKRGCA